jgi:uncharacterized protein YegJ (DUF2314 family)
MSKIFYAQQTEAMQRASEAARATFKYFWRELSWEYRRIIPALDVAAVKAPFNDPGAPEDNTEHMWLNQVSFDGDTIHATLLNQPNRLQSVNEGDEVSLKLDGIEDWLVGAQGKAYGGFTIHEMRKGMNKTARAEHDAAWGFDFGDEPALPLWKGMKTPDDEHPMSGNMSKELAKAIDQNPNEFLKSADDSGLTTLHSLALGGSVACVEVLLAKGADVTRKTKSGKTAHDLAMQMGWPSVAALIQRRSHS